MLKYNRSQYSIARVLENPWLWILLLVCIRIGCINEAPFGGHTWRQTITLGVARNYLEWDSNFFRPRTILCGARDGILAQEFPVYNYLVFLGWKIFGQENWVFRAILLVVNSFGLYWFYKIVRQVFNHRAALVAMTIMGSSIMFTYSFKAMPDTFAVSLILGAVWYGWKYLMNQKPDWRHPLVFVALASLGILSKIPALVVLALLLIPLLSKEIMFKRKIVLSGLVLLSLLLGILWYYLWVPWAERTYMYPLFYPRTINTGVSELLALSRATIERFETIALQSRFMFYLCATGFLALILRKQKILLLVSILYISGFLFFMIKAGDVFPTHEYYVIPFIPLLALLGGYLLDSMMPEKFSLLPLVLLCISGLGISAQWKNFQLTDDEKKYHRLEAICNSYIPEDSRIMVSNDDANPMMLYFCHRKGWANDELWKNERWIRGQIADGLEYIVVERFRHDQPLSFPLIYEDEDFLIYKTTPPQEE